MSKIAVIIIVFLQLFMFQNVSSAQTKIIWPTDDLPTEQMADMAVYVIRMELPRLGFPRDTDLTSIRKFVDMVKFAESSGNRFAVSSAGAMSFFQFKPDSVVTAVNRFENWTKRNSPLHMPAWANELRKNPELIFKVRESLQAMLMMINIVEQRGSDEYLIKLINGDEGAAKTLYYKFHHTAPDEQTVALIDRLFEEYFTLVS